MVRPVHVITDLGSGVKGKAVVRLQYTRQGHDIGMETVLLSTILAKPVSRRESTS